MLFRSKVPFTEGEYVGCVGFFDCKYVKASTVSIPVNRRQSFKFSYSQGAYISIEGDYKNVSAAWLYSWVSNSK
jgi:hypothetical protein